MKPEVPAQVPSVEAFLVAVDAAEEVFVEVFTVEEAAFGVDEAAFELETALPEQVPKADWQPVEQWSVVDPHHPYLDELVILKDKLSDERTGCSNCRKSSLGK